MKLQVALDRLTKERCLELTEQLQEEVDWMEVGTGVIKAYGLDIVTTLKERYPALTLVADLKTCDAGWHETSQAFDAGADITTVMAFSHDRTITDSLEVARQRGKRVMVDLLQVEDRARIQALQDLGVDLVALHIGKDRQGSESGLIDHWHILQGYRGEVAVAGGITAETLSVIAESRPDVVIAGSAITLARHPLEQVRRLKEAMRR